MFNELDWRSCIIRWRKVTGISLTFLEFDIFTLSAEKKDNYLYLSVFVKMKVIWMSFYFSHHLILSWYASVFFVLIPVPPLMSGRIIVFFYLDTNLRDTRGGQGKE